MSELEFKIAKAICELNRWETPSAIQGEIKRGLNRNSDEFHVAMAALEAFVPKSKWLLVWNEQVTAPTPEIEAV